MRLLFNFVNVLTNLVNVYYTFKRIWRLAYHDTRPVPNPLLLNRSTVHSVQSTLLFFTAIHSPITQSQITDCS